MKYFNKVMDCFVSRTRLNLLRIGLLLPAIFISSASFAAEPVCAVVKIEIQQELTLERQAFDAVMRINNGLDLLSLENVNINVTFKDETGTAVEATSNTTSTTAKFFIKVDSMTGIDAIDGTGSVAPKTTAEVHWLIIPAPGAGGVTPSGKLYFVGASLEYNLGGELQTTIVTPDSIYVKPLPLLSLDYFLEKDVFADDAFTPEVEPAIPFTLGVRVKNNGAASATGLKIDSAQPIITENAQGLLIGFNIIGSNVNELPSTNSLLIDFGEIKPNEASMGRWDMVTTLSGRFTEFTADFSHADELGGRLTSIIDPAGINTHTLIRNVRVDVAGRDFVRDFLALDGIVYRVYESSGIDTDVTDVSGSSNLTPVSSGTEVSLNFTIPVTAGFSYAKIKDPYAGTKVVKQMVRSDGKAIPLDNVWTSKTRNLNTNPPSWDYWFNVFDANSTGTYVLFMGAPDLGPVAPEFTPLNNITTYETATITFPVSATDANGDAVTLTAGTLPTDATFTSDTSGSGTFTWTPAVGQAGHHTITFTASDGSLITQTSITIKVNPVGDTDGDGMDDAWEILMFGDLSRDGLGDLDGDGISDLQEYLNNTNPNLDPPLAPINLVALPGNAENTLSWDTVTGVDSYNVYWGLTADVTPTNGTQLNASASPFVHSGLDNDVTYYYIVTSVGAGGESAASIVVSVTTGVRDWTAPNVFGNAAGTYGQNVDIAMTANGDAIAVWQQTNIDISTIMASRYVVGTGWSIPVAISNTTLNASNPKVSIDEAGNAIAVWQEGSTTQSDILAARYDVVTGWKAATAIETDAANAAIKPQIEMTKAGTAFVVWQQGSSIYTNRYESSVWQTESLLSDETNFAISDLKIAINESGEGFATWTASQDQASFDLRLSQLSSNIWSTPTSVATGLDNAINPAITINDSGNALLAWTAFDGTNHILIASAYTTTGGWTTAQTIGNAIGDAKSPQLVMDATGNAYVTWTQSSSPYSVYVKRYDAAAAWQTADVIEQRQRGNASKPQLSLDLRGNLVVTWQQDDGVQQNILAAVYDNGLSTWSAERVIETNNSGHATSPVIAMNDSGNAIVAWQQDNAGELVISTNHFEAGNTGIPNINPIAVAGVDQTVDEETVVTLDGSKSFDQDGSGLVTAYSWTQTAGAALTLTGATTATPSFTAPVVLETAGSQVFTFALTVTDDANATSTQTMTVTVNPVNAAPVANAGVDKIVNEQSLASLSAAGSADSDGNIASYQWAQVSGIPVTLSSTNTASTSFTAPLVYADTAFVFLLTVTDNEGGSTSDSVTITVSNINPDDDGDGLDDAWEMLHFGNLDQIATTDSDGDGYTNLQEYTQGTNPVAVTPMPPATLQAVATEEGVHLRWDAVMGATGYNIYWANSTGVTKETGTVINHTTNSYTHSGLTVGTTYYYIITAIVADESLASIEVNATPGMWAWKTPVHLNVTNYDDSIFIDDATKPRMAMTKDHSQGVMAWVQDDAAYEINLQLWVSHYTTATGWGTPINISTSPAGYIIANDTMDAAAVEVAIDEQGNAIVVWRQRPSTNFFSFNLYAKRYTPQTGWGIETQLNTEESYVYNHKIAMSPDGEATVVWQQSDSIWANRYDATGWGTATLIETNISNSFKRPNVAIDANGDAMAVWYGYDDTLYSVWANRYDTITGWGTATLLHTDNVHQNVLANVVMDSSGNATAVWLQCDFTWSCLNVMSRQYTTAGAWDTVQVIGTQKENGKILYNYPQLANNDRGEIAVVWAQFIDGQNELQINRYSPASGWAIAESLNSSVSETMVIDMNTFGEIAVAWYSEGGNFLTKRYVPGKGWTSSTLINATSFGSSENRIYPMLDLTMMPDGQAIFAYNAGGFPAISHSPLVTTALPLVDAGPDQTVYEGETVTLSGTSSTATYIWRQYSGAEVNLEGGTTATPSFVAKVTNDEVKANFALRTESLDGYVSTDTVTITVRDINIDTDNDGMADHWEQQHFGNLDQTGNEDFDADGISNLDEFNTGTDPTIAGPPAPPSDLSATSDNGANTLSWTTVSGVTAYNIYWGTTPGVTKTTGTLISSVTNPYTHRGLTSGTPYYYVVTAVGVYGESAESMEVRVTPGSWAWKLPVKLNEGTEPNHLSSYIAPKVVMNANGQGVMSWFQNYSLWVSHYNSDTGWGSPVNIVPNINNDKLNTHNIDIDDEGNIIVIWTQNPYGSLYAKRYTPVGGWGAAQLLETSDTWVNSSMEPSIAMSANGSAIVTWTQDDGTKYSIWATRYDPVTEWGAATLLEIDDAYGNWTPKVVIDSQGNAIVVWWRSYGLGIFAKRYDVVSGWGSVERLDNSSNASYPEIGMDASGNALVVWNGLVGGPVGIFAARYTPAGGWGSDQKIGFDNLPGEELTYPHVAFNDRGEAAVVWSWYKENEWSEIRTNRYTPGSGWSKPESFTPTTRQTYTSDYYSLVTGVTINNFGDIAMAWWEDSGRYWTKNYKSNQGWSASTVMNNVPHSDGYVKRFVNFDLAMDANGHAIFAYDANGLPGVSHFSLFSSLPNAAAGADQTVYSGDRVTLDGQGSTGTIAGYRWTEPRFVDIGLVDDTTSTPEFTAPKGPSVFDFALTTVSAEGAMSASDIVKISVTDGDSDNDGLHDAWEQQHFGNLVNDGNLDSDGDGISDYDEYEVGTDPWVAGPPAAPAVVKAVASDSSNNIAWTSVGGASSYNLYWSIASGVTKSTGTLVANISSSYAHTGLANGTAYYYVVTAIGLNGESVESAEATATPGIKAWAAAPALAEANDGTAINPKIVVDKLRNSIAVWQQTDGTYYSIWANRYDSLTGIWGTPELLETSTSADHQNPYITMDRAGNVLAVWSSSSGSIYSNYYNAGSGWSAYQQIGSDGGRPELTMNANGQAIAAWQCSTTEVCTNRFDGVWTGTSTLDSDNRTGTVGLVSVAINVKGNGVVAWPQDGNIWTQRFSALKQDWQAAEVADTNNLGNTSSPKVAMDFHGNITTIWNQLSATDNLWANRYGRIVGWSTPSLIENDDSANASDSQLEIDLNGNALVLWDHEDDILSTYYTFDVGWNAVPSIFALPNGSSAPNEPRLALSSVGNGVAVFSYVKSGKRLLYASPYIIGQGWGDLSAISAGEPSNPDIVIAPDGKASVIWSELGDIIMTTQHQ